MCRGCLDLVDAVVAPISAHVRGDRGMRVMCDHVPYCGYRALRPSERERWLREHLPGTFTMLCLREDYR